MDWDTDTAEEFPGDASLLSIPFSSAISSRFPTHKFLLPVKGPSGRPEPFGRSTALLRCRNLHGRSGTEEGTGYSRRQQGEAWSDERVVLLCPAQLVRSSSRRSRKARASRPLDPAVQPVFHRALNLEFSPGNGDAYSCGRARSPSHGILGLPRPGILHALRKLYQRLGPVLFWWVGSHRGRQPVRGVFRCPCLGWRQSSSQCPVREDVRLGLRRFVRRKKLPGVLLLFAPYHSSVRSDVIQSCAGEAGPPAIS